ncbi:MAG: hypothetical protein HC902_03885 [Calothrix sp. SM1_5_4]|nr:hypothetical protein [Calothrix sp. SM1_5_4]
MKRLLTAMALIASIGSASSAMAASAQPNTKEVNISVNDAYVPGGFSSDTDAYVVISGVFPNSCYRWNRAEVTDKTATNHEVKAYAMVSESMCLMVLVPYTQEVKLGRLQRGEHTLRFVNGDGTYFEKNLVVE